MKLASVSLITGLSLCLEFIEAMPEEDIPNSIVFDLLIFRFIFTVGQT